MLKQLHDRQAKTTKGYLTCVHCYHEGADVSIHQNYVGGQGYVDFLECDDRLACWNRINKMGV